MEYLLILVSLFLIVIGVFGCVVKGIPGTPFSFLGLVVLNLSQGGSLFSILPLVLGGVLVLMVWIPDFFVPWWHEKMYEVSHTTTWGGLLGMMAGFFIFPPAGIVVGIILGSVIGEMIAKKEMRRKLDEEGFSIGGVMTAMITKLSVSAVLTYYYFLNLINLNLRDIILKYQYNKFIDLFRVF